MISIRLRRLKRRLSYFTVVFRALRPGMQGVISLSFNASLNQSACFGSLGPMAFTCAVPAVCDQPVGLWKLPQQGRRAGVVADLPRRHVEGDRAAKPAMIRANTPISLHRFQRLYKVLCGPYSLAAPHHRNPLRLMKIIPLRTRLSSTRGLPWLLGKKGSRRSICASVSQKRLLIDRSPCGAWITPRG